jgi:hypothetical protein
MPFKFEIKAMLFPSGEKLGEVAEPIFPINPTERSKSSCLSEALTEE